MVKRPTVDTLLRGLDNTIANWPVIVLRLGEALLMVGMVVASALAVFAPLAVSLGVQLADVDTPEEVLDVLSAFVQRWTLLLWIFLAVCLLLLLFVAVHSFVVAGCARVAVDGDAAAGPATQGPRTRFRAFTMTRWLESGVQGWWPVFWIYNVAWGVAGLVLLIPLLPTLALLLLLAREEQPALTIVVGCSGLVLTLLLGIAVAIVTSVWTNRAIAGWAVRRESAREALRSSWRALRTDLARHALIALAIFVVAGAGSSFFGSLSMFSTFGDHPFTISVRMFSWFLSSAFSAATTTWFLASYAALARENAEPH